MTRVHTRHFSFRTFSTKILFYLHFFHYLCTAKQPKPLSLNHPKHSTFNLQSLSTRSILLIATSAVVLIATIVALSGTISSASRRMEKKLYGEEIGNNHLRYKHGDHIYNPETGEILLDSIDWLHVNYSDTIAILAKNNRRA